MENLQLYKVMQKHDNNFLPPLGAVLATIVRRLVAAGALSVVLCGTVSAASQYFHAVSQADLVKSVPASGQNVFGLSSKHSNPLGTAENATSTGGNLVLPNSFVQRVQANQHKSRRQVIDEVERTYNAKVLKVSLDQGAGVYVVRILQSDGRVRTIRVSAYR